MTDFRFPGSLAAGLFALMLFHCAQPRAGGGEPEEASALEVDLAGEEARVLRMADEALAAAPITLTSARAGRSAGGANDFYSEGDYWWPDPEDPAGPYIRRDGQTNPDNFVAHRQAMRALSRHVAALTAAHKLRGDERYATKARELLRVFFLDAETRMSPHLLYAQAIQGRHTGRGIGIIDAIHLIEVARSVEVLRDAGALPPDELASLVAWFDAFATWLTTHPYGLDERDHGNNHSTWWAAQVAAFSRLAGRDDLLELARQRYKDLLGSQMDSLGGFTDELGRTKPYIYMLFNLEGYSTLAEIASTPGDDLWAYRAPRGGLRDAWAFMLPAIADKSSWGYPPDIQNFDEVPIRTPGMLFAARAYGDADLLAQWRRLSPERASEEVDRNFPLRQPTLWVD